MNKTEELSDFISEHEIDVAFISESFDRESKSLHKHLNLPDHQVISNIYQRKETGGRPVLIVNKIKYDVEDLTNTVIQIPWGVEIVWAKLTPKLVSQDSIVQSIILASIYSKPQSKKKSAMHDHIAETYNFLSTKYGKGLYWLMAGDTNDLSLGPILNLSPNLRSLVTKPTRLNPDSILDNVISDMGKWYQSPDTLPPLQADPGSRGKESDHLIVLMSPISEFNNKPARVVRSIPVRPLRQTGIDLFGFWLKKQNWSEVLLAKSVNEKAETFQSMLLQKVNEFLPTKVRKISSDDQPFWTEKLQKMKRQKAREYQKNRKSLKWMELNKSFKLEVSKAKKQYYKNFVKDLKRSKPSEWYSKLKRICSYDQGKSNPIIVESIKHLSDEEQANKIADKFASVSQEYDPLRSDDVNLPKFDAETIPQFKPCDVQKQLEKVKVNKSVPPGDIPPKLMRMFAAELSVPLTDIINSSIRLGSWPKLYKAESVTPVPKIFPPKSLTDLRNISGLLTFNKVAEKLIAELIIDDMSVKLDPSQYANQHGLSLQHYLVKLIDRILTETDGSARGEVKAVLATFYDWKEAFPRQCHKLGVKAFLDCGVRPSLLPMIVNYMQERTMVVKWHGKMSSIRKLNGGGAQGATFGIWEYLAQSNENANCVDPDDRFKFVDDLSVLEIIHLLTIGMASINPKHSVPSDVPSHNQVIPTEHLKSQVYLDNIKKWSDNQKMILNEKKTKAMVFNFTNDHQFIPRLTLNNKNIETVEKTKLLGVTITNDLKWNENTQDIVRRAFSRMELLRKVAAFHAPMTDLINIYVLYIRSILEQSCIVWHSMLSKENVEDLERVQKAALKIILGTKFINYENALQRTNLETLEKRRESLCLKFAKKCTQNEKTFNMFPINKNYHSMKLRNREKYVVKFANTDRLKNSAIPYMQRLLNNELNTKKIRKPG